MSQRGLLYDVMANAWEALTPDQRVCWHFAAARTPITLQDGELFTENGWQSFVDKNSPIAVVDQSLILTDPPTASTPPTPLKVTGTTWPLPAKFNGGPSQRRPAPILKLTIIANPMPVVLIKQNYHEFRLAFNATPATQRVTTLTTTGQAWLTTGAPPEYVTLTYESGPRPDVPKINKKPSIRHVTTWQTGDPAEFSTDLPGGYFATTAGVNRFATVKGKTARRRPDLPLLRTTWVDVTLATRLTTTVANPIGGSPSKIRRPRHYP